MSILKAENWIVASKHNEVIIPHNGGFVLRKATVLTDTWGQKSIRTSGGLRTLGRRGIGAPTLLAMKYGFRYNSTCVAGMRRNVFESNQSPPVG